MITFYYKKETVILVFLCRLLNLYPNKENKRAYSRNERMSAVWEEFLLWYNRRWIKTTVESVGEIIYIAKLKNVTKLRKSSLEQAFEESNTYIENVN